MPVTLRRAGWPDAWRLWQWRNDPTTRALMRHTAPIPLGDHLRWFARLSSEHGAFQFVAESSEGEAVGSGRLDLAEGVAEFDLTIAPGYRGQAYGTAVIAALVAEARGLDCATCRAVVRRENVASRRAFARNGFTIVSNAEDGYFVMERPC